MIGAPGAVGMDDCYESRPGSPHIVLPAKAGIHGAGGRGGYARHVQLPAGRQRPNFITSCGLNKAIVIPRSAARHAGQCSAGPDKGNPSMKKTLAAIACALVVAFAAACGSGGDKNSVASLPTADISSFPTPSGSQATRAPDPQPTSLAPDAETQEDSDDAESLTADAPPITPEEIQELRERLGRGELSEEEAREAFLRLREQFGGGQGGFGPGGFGGSQAAGTIESIDGNTITVATELAAVMATVGENASINITSVLEPTGLTDDTQVVVVSERVEGGNLARSITIVPEGQGAFGRGQGGFGGFGGGQGAQGGTGGLAEGGVRPLIGTVTDIADGGFTLETQQGPLPISINNETVIIETRQGSVADLETGMQVTVVGPADEEGTIDARVVNVIPEGLDDVRGLGGGGGRNPLDRDSAGP